MTLLERQMLDLLKCGRDEFGFRAVRAEFEAEGASNEDLMRLTELGYKAGLDLYLKIGGCEAVSNLIQAKQAGASAIIAPMIESPYALQKYAIARDRVYCAEDQQGVAFYYNIETIQAYNCQEAIICEAGKLGLSGVVFGRVDFVGSQGLSRLAINTSEITEKVLVTARLCRDYQQKFILGGGIAVESVATIREIASCYLTRFETRKIAFDTSISDSPKLIQGIIEASNFELLWLKNKQSYNSLLQREELKRIQMLESRIVSIAA